MWQLREVGHGEPPVHQPGVALVHQAHHPVPEERLTDPREAVPERAHEHVMVDEDPLGVAHVRSERLHFQPDPGRPLAQPLQQRGVDDRQGVVAHRQPEDSVTRPGLEGHVDLQRSAHQPQRLLHLGQQLPRERGELELSPVAHEQLVAEVPPQARQRPAHRRLAHLQPLARPGDVAFLEQYPKGDQQVEVRTTERHGAVSSRRTVKSAALPGTGRAPTMSRTGPGRDGV